MIHIYIYNYLVTLFRPIFSAIREEREREYKKRGGRSTSDSWFRKKKTNKTETTTSILRVPFTKGKLKRNIDKTIKEMKTPRGTKTVAQEDSGEKLLYKLVRSDPFPVGDCNREGCKTVVKGVERGCKGTCWQQHVNYTIVCKECEIERREGVKNVRYEYRGESSRGCYKRFESHLRAGQNGFMHKHEIENHRGARQIEYLIKREKVDKDPMRRILRESIRIESAVKNRAIKLMNTKEEHFGIQTVRAKFGRDIDFVSRKYWSE